MYYISTCSFQDFGRLVNYSAKEFGFHRHVFDRNYLNPGEQRIPARYTIQVLTVNGAKLDPSCHFTHTFQIIAFRRRDVIPIWPDFCGFFVEFDTRCLERQLNPFMLKI